jgi:lipopolysaccharide export system permease protein
MIKVTTRYLASHFIPPFLIGFIFFVAFLITFYMFRIISLIVTKGIDLGTVSRLVLDLSVSFLPLATPLAVFFATIYTLNKFSEDSEIIALRSFGISKFKIYFPFFILSLLIGISISSLNGRYIPFANANFRNTILKLTSTGMLTSIKSGQFFTDIPRVTLFAESVNDEGDSFENVFLHLRSDTAGMESVIFAKKGALVKLFADEWHAPSLRLNLSSGNIIKIDQAGEQTEKILFEQYDFPVFSTDFSSSILDKDSMKSNAELLLTIQKKKDDLNKLVETKPYKPEFPQEKKEIKKSLAKSEIEYYARFLTLPQVVLFVLLGFSLGIKNGRGPSSNNSLKAIVILLSFYAIYFFLISMAQRGVVPTVFVPTIPTFFLLITSLFYFKKLDWVA